MLCCVTHIPNTATFSAHVADLTSITDISDRTDTPYTLEPTGGKTEVLKECEREHVSCKRTQQLQREDEDERGP